METFNFTEYVDFAMKVEGEGMAPVLNDGDIVFIRQADSFADGDLACVAIDGKSYVGYLYHNGLLTRKKARPISVPDDDCFIGLVVGSLWAD